MLMRTHASLQSLTSKKPVPSQMYRISSSVCRCSSKKIFSFAYKFGSFSGEMVMVSV
jgi:hypothetical protein